MGAPASPRLGTLFTRGTRSGATRAVTLGYVPAEGGALLVTSVDGARQWMRNLRASPDCEFEMAGSRRPYRADEVLGPDLEATRRAYEERYPSFRGRVHGPPFRLSPR